MPGRVKEIWNDHTIAAGEVDVESILCSSVHKIYLSFTPSANNLDLDLIHVTVRVGEQTNVTRYSAEQLACIWALNNNADADSFSGGDKTTYAILAVDVGSTPVPKGSQLYLEIDNGDPEALIVNASALVDEGTPATPILYNKSDDNNFHVNNLLDVFAWDSNGDLESGSYYVQIDDVRLSVEQCYLRTVAESSSDLSATTSFALLHDEDVPSDSEIINENSGTVTLLYTSAWDSPEVDKAVIEKVKPMVEKKIKTLSASNKRVLARSTGRIPKGSLVGVK